MFGASPIPGLGAAGGFKFIVEDRGGLGLAALQKPDRRPGAETQQKLPGLNSVATQFRSNTPQLFLDIDRDQGRVARAWRWTDVNQTLDMCMGSLYVNSFNEFGRHWQVTVQAEGEYRNRVEDLNLFQVRNNRGQMVLVGHAGPPARDRRPDRRPPLQPVHRRVGQRQHRHRATAPAT